MTESEAIKELKEDISLYDNEITRLDTSIGTPDRNLIDALEMAIRALEEIQQYREVGTVDECREARNKQVSQEVNLRLCRTIDCSDKDCVFCDRDVDRCPCCNEDLSIECGLPYKYCPNCGQKLDWRDEHNEAN